MPGLENSRIGLRTAQCSLLRHLSRVGEVRQRDLAGLASRRDFNATYCASKHAALAVTDDAHRAQRGQGTHVAGVYAGFIDTDMAAELADPSQPRTSPRQVADRTLEGIANGIDHVRADARSEEVWNLIQAGTRTS